MQLSDSDIFKAQIYRHLSSGKRHSFVEEWKSLTAKTEEVRGLSIEDLFRHYSYVIRAKEDKPIGRKRIELKKFYQDENSRYLREPGLMETLHGLADFWVDIEKQEFNDRSSFSDKAIEYIHCLSYYPNEEWKYLVSVFYHINAGKANFAVRFEKLLKSMAAFLFLKFLHLPTLDAVRKDIFEACVRIAGGSDVDFDTGFYNASDDWKENFKNAATHQRLRRSLLVLNAYIKGESPELMRGKWEVEHIVPVKWQDTSYFGWDKNDAEDYLERFGNLALIEKKLNIQAGNGYFGQKKEKYRESKFKEVQELSESPQNDWRKEDIDRREQEFIDTILTFCKSELGIS